jgi:hypothetical protein
MAREEKDAHVPFSPLTSDSSIALLNLCNPHTEWPSPLEPNQVLTKSSLRLARAEGATSTAPGCEDWHRKLFVRSRVIEVLNPALKETL